MARLFLAVWPPANVFEQLDALPRSDQPGVRWVPPANWHVTLRFFGEAEASDVHAGLADATLPAATAIFGPAVRRLGRSALVVPVAGLERLAAAISAVTVDIGDPPDTRSFNGHLTLARLRPPSRGDLAGTPIAARCPVTEVVLVRSDLGHDGATYDVVDRWVVDRRPTV
ncbi:MAG TPA: RNA 2',3'-cyclic phosphodiesterase [Ilumatobacteraceae bacterium]|nr:RNA 2',3'-cyclic phosphodiesterase [Ilumatobacteraceae bacterium]